MLTGSASHIVRSVIFAQAKSWSKSLVFGRYYSNKMSKTACVLIANGSEEMEAVITIDVLRRGGLSVDVASVDACGPVKCSRDVTIVPDRTISEALTKEYDLVVLPGGLKGSEAFSNSAEVGQMLKAQEKAGRFIGAICAAPTALKAHSIHLGAKLTSYPAMAEAMRSGAQYTYLEQAVVCDGQLVTSRGPGTATAFALALVDKLAGQAKATEVAKGMLLDYP